MANVAGNFDSTSEANVTLYQVGAFETIFDSSQPGETMYGRRKFPVELS